MLSAAEVSSYLVHYGETILECSVQITKGIHEAGNDIVLRYVCALLNSGGGVIHLFNVDCRRYAQAKHLDVWWSGMECQFANILSEDDLCNYFDFIGNYDDADLYLFVKTAEHFCTLDFHARLPTDTATHEVTYQSVLKLLSKPKTNPGSLKDLPKLPDTFVYRQTAENLKKETKQIQFKQLSNPREKSKYTLPDRIRYLITKYVSAFANNEGGHIFFGIEDDRALVMGESMSQHDIYETEKKVSDKMDSFVWGHPSFKAKRGVHWDIQFIPLHKLPKKENRVICLVSVVHFPGGVFSSLPESYAINSDGGATLLEFDDWKSQILAPTKDIPDLTNKFVKLPLRVPNARLIYTLPHAVQQIKDKLFKASREVQVQPRNILGNHSEHDLNCITSVLDFFRRDNAFAIAAHCWGLNIPRIVSDLPSKVLDILVISETHGLHLITFAHENSDRIHAHNKHASQKAKQVIVQHGGCVEKFGIACHVVAMNESGSINKFSKDLKRVQFPSHYTISPHKVDAILTALAIAMAAYRPDNSATMPVCSPDSMDTHGSLSLEYYHLLTLDQFELLWTQQYTKELWIHGPPGCGKTIAAVQFIKELRRRGCGQADVLYISEHEKLSDFVKSFNICLTTHRREFLSKNQSDTEFDSCYGNVKNIIIDEVQNFKERDGNWYSLAENLVKSNTCEGPMYGYFWLFMDYATKVHKFSAGLPHIIGKNNFMLSEITRNSAEIFNYAKQFMKKPTTDPNIPPEIRCPSPKLAHQFKGSKIEVLKCNANIANSLSDILQKYTEQGGDLKDVAVLFSKQKALSAFRSSTQSDCLPEPPDKSQKLPPTSPRQRLKRSHSLDLTLDTVKEFSGLEKKCVIGIDPQLNEDHADFDKYMVNLASRATDNLIILTSSDELLKRLGHRSEAID